MNQAEAVNTLINNINVFANIISRGTYDNITWSREDLNHAFRWSAYCQQMANLVGEMSSHLKAFTKAMKTLKSAVSLPIPLNINTLKIAPDILLECLVYNPSLPAHLSDAMLRMVSNEYKDNVRGPLCTPEKAVLISNQCRQVQAALQLLEEKLTSITTLSAKDVNKEADSCVRRLIEQLAVLMEVSPSDSIWFDCRLRLVLSKWTDLPQGWAVLLSSLCMDMRKVESNRRHSVSQLMPFIVRWIMCIYRLTGNSCPLMLLSPSLMAKVAECNSDFCKWYIETMGNIGDGLKDTYVYRDVVYSQLMESLSMQKYGNPLRLTSEATRREVADLQERFSHLLNQDAAVKRQVIELVFERNRPKDRAPDVWTMIAESLADLNGGRSE